MLTGIVSLQPSLVESCYSWTSGKDCGDVRDVLEKWKGSLSEYTWLEILDKGSFQIKRSRAADDANEKMKHIWYIDEKTLQDLRQKLAANEAISQRVIKGVVSSRSVPDENMMVPVDMRDAADMDRLIDVLSLGPKGAAELFMKAREYFMEDKDQRKSGAHDGKRMEGSPWDRRCRWR